MDVDTQPGESSKSSKPHDFLWFPDGNVVLATDAYLFKVYKGLLSLHSSVFRDMFELTNVDESIAGQCSSGIMQEMYEGLPLVRLVGDEGEDVAHLLRTIFDHDYYHRDNDKAPLEVITALLVLSTKYDFKTIRRDVIIHVAKLYPTNLEDYDLVDNDSLPLFGKDRRDCHFQLLRAAYKADVDLLLPILFFACSDYGIEWIFDIAGSMAPGCFRTLVVGREALDEDLDRLVSDLPEYLRKAVKTDECRDKGSCLAVGHFSTLSSLVHPFFQETKGSDIVEMYLTPSCTRCKSVLAKSIDRRREDVWAKIPSYFGFPAWEVIQLKLEELAESQYETQT